MIKNEKVLCKVLFIKIKVFVSFQEYSEDSNSEPDVDLENQYYNSKSLKEDDPKAALNSFQKVFLIIVFSSLIYIC